MKAFACLALVCLLLALAGGGFLACGFFGRESSQGERTSGRLPYAGRPSTDGSGVERRIARLFLEIEDGDTIVYRGVAMRFMGVDTPEIKKPDLGFYEDQPYGRAAKEFTRRELKRARRVSYRSDGVDRYDRLLVHVFIDGYPLSLRIVEEGLGYETVSFYGDNGYPEIAGRILEAARLHSDLPFENPYIWRRKHRR